MGEKQIAVKAQQVEELQAKLKAAETVVLHDYIGLTVEEVTNLRAKFREAGVEYHVIKNGIVRRAVDGLGYEGLNEYLVGPTAVAISDTDAVAPAKVLNTFIKQVKKTQMKAGIMNGQILDLAGVIALAEMPSREELLSRLVGSMNNSIASFVRVLDAYRKQKEEGAPAAAPAAEQAAPEAPAAEAAPAVEEAPAVEAAPAAEEAPATEE